MSNNNTLHTLILETFATIVVAAIGLFGVVPRIEKGIATEELFFLLFLVVAVAMARIIAHFNHEKKEELRKRIEYETILSELSMLALCLPAKPDKEDLLHFLDLEEQAEKHETEIDIRKGITGRTAVTTELDEMALFQMARCARRNGKTTNEYILEQVAKTMKAEQNENANR